MRLIILGALSALLLSACGYQGPLYLPDAKSAPKQSTAPALDAVAAEPIVDAVAVSEPEASDSQTTPL